MPAAECDRVLVRGVNWIGDAVMTMPALRSLRLANRNARISLLVKPWVSPLFEKDPNVDEIIPYSGEYESLYGKLRLARRLRKERFCSAVLFQNAFDAALIAAMSGIPERIGYRRDGRSLLLTKAVACGEGTRKVHHIEYYLNLLSAAGVPVAESRPWVYLSIEERISARERLQALKRPLIALNPGSTFGSSKRWSTGRFAELAGKVIAGMNGSVVILGGSNEMELAEEIRSLIGPGGPSRALSLAGNTGLRELAAVISECDVLVTNDSGPMHIGYATGTPLVAIFGSTSPDLTGPPASGSVVLNKEVECSPCFERECSRGDLRCMDMISAEEAFAAAGSLLKRERAVFFDRDGTLCRDAHYLNRMEDLEIYQDTELLAALKERDFLLIGVTNQSGIARGIVDEGFVRSVNDIFCGRHGFSAFYYCPHHPGEGCSCRKPEPGLLVRARNDFGIELRRSFVVGDKESDMALAKAVGATGVFINRTGGPPPPTADIAARDLREAVCAILELEKR